MNGKLTVMLEKKPSGGFLMKGIESEGAKTKDVPGGRANLPSLVTQRILFCLEWGTSSGASAHVVEHNAKHSRNKADLTSIQNLKN